MLKKKMNWCKNVVFCFFVIGGIIGQNASAQPVVIKTVNEAFEYAIDTNHQFAIARNSLLETFEVYNLAFKDFLPKISLSGSVHPWSISVEDDKIINGNTFASERLTLVQPLFSWFSTVFDVNSANHTIDVAVSKYNNEQQNILKSIAKSYSQIVTTRTNLLLQDRRLQQSKLRIESARDTYNLGSLSQTSLALAEAELASATVQFIRTKRQLEEYESLLEDLAGVKVADNAKLPNFRAFLTNISEEEDFLQSEERFVQAVMQSNYLLKSAQAADKLASLRYTQTLSTPLPIKLDLVLSGVWSQKFGDNIPQFKTVDQRYAVEIQGVVQLYQGGYAGSIRRKFHAIRDKVESEYALAKQTISRSALQLFRRRQDNKILLSASTSAVEASKMAKEGFVAGEKLGLYSKIDVLEAEKQFYATKFEHANTQQIVINTDIEVLALLGKFTPEVLNIKSKQEDPNISFKYSRWNISHFE